MEKKLLIDLRYVVTCGYNVCMETNTNFKPVKYQNGYTYRGVTIFRSARYSGKFYSCRQQYAAGIQGLHTARHLGTLSKITEHIDRDIDVLNCAVLRGKTFMPDALAHSNRVK